VVITNHEVLATEREPEGRSTAIVELENYMFALFAVQNIAI